jgi:hypothetical protein
MKVLVISESDYEYTAILAVVTSMDKAVEIVKGWHKQKSARVEVGVERIDVRYRGAIAAYDVKEFVLDSAPR